jgi:hypothetical protein
VILGHGFQRLGMQAVDAAVAHMQQVASRPFRISALKVQT